MKTLINISESESVFVLEMQCEDYVDHLNSLGMLPEKLITVIKNPSGKAPLVIEIDGDRFALGKDIAKTVYVMSMLDGQEYIFDENHKKTKQRGIIIDVLKKQEGHFSLDEITKNVQSEDPQIGSITVYRTIKILCDKGILDTLMLSDGSKRFEIKKGEHAHIICRTCLSIIDLMDDSVYKLQEEIAKKQNLDITRQNLKLFTDECSHCKNK